MKKENQVCSLELAKKLKELGFLQVSLFYWDETGTWINYNPSVGNGYYSAYTVAELGEFLSTLKLRSDLMELNFGCYHTGSFYNFFGNYKYDSHETNICSDKNEANMRAKMLIYLKENNLIN